MVSPQTHTSQPHVTVGLMILQYFFLMIPPQTHTSQPHVTVGHIILQYSFNLIFSNSNLILKKKIFIIFLISKCYSVFCLLFLFFCLVNPVVIFSKVSDEISATVYKMTRSGYVDTKIYSKSEMFPSYG